MNKRLFSLVFVACFVISADISCGIQINFKNSSGVERRLDGPFESNPEPWPNQEEFLNRLAKIDAYLKGMKWNPNFCSRRIPMPDRKVYSYFEKNKKLSSISYHLIKERMIWTANFGPYYVAKYNVKPSKEFYDFVMNYEFETEKSIQFDREKMKDVEGLHGPFKSNSEPWLTQEYFLKKLLKIEKELEKKAQKDLMGEYVLYVETWVNSYFEGTQLSSKVYFSGNIGWSANFGSHYIAIYNVKPSKEFYNFVMNYEFDIEK